MNLFEFIILQQTTYPDVFATLLAGVFAWIWLTTIGVILVSLLHGFPTQKMVYNYTEATRIPERNYMITGKLKEEIAEQTAIKRRNRKTIKNAVEWCKNHPKELAIVAFVLFVYILIMGAI